MNNKDFMRLAIRLSIENVKNGGGPFGAVITKDSPVVAMGVNSVVPQNDPTAHAEVSAIRNACTKLNTFDLSGCEIYSSCEPCPMCLSAIYWAHLNKLYFANTRSDAEEIGFGDSFIYNEVSLPVNRRKLPTETFLRNEALQAFQDWKDKEDKAEY